MLSALPPALRADVSGGSALRFLRAVPLLAGASPSLLAALAPRMERVVAYPGTVLCARATPQHGVYVLARGAAQERRGSVYGPACRTLGSGTVVGHPQALVSDAAPRHPVVAVTYCEVWFLAAVDLARALAQHSDRLEVRRLRRRARALAGSDGGDGREGSDSEDDCVGGRSAAGRKVTAAVGQGQSQGQGDASSAGPVQPGRARSGTRASAADALESLPALDWALQEAVAAGAATPARRPRAGTASDAAAEVVMTPATPALTRRPSLFRPRKAAVTAHTATAPVPALTRVHVTAACWHPDSAFAHGWAVARFAAVLWLALAVPAEAAIVLRHAGLPGAGAVARSVLNYAADLLLAADAVLVGAALAVRVDGALVASQPAIWRHYRRGAFPLDLIAALPTDVLALAFAAPAQALPRLRLNRAARIVRLPFLFRDAEAAVAFWRGVAPGPAARRLMRVFPLVLLVAWFVAGGWVLVSDASTALWGHADSWIRADAENPARELSGLSSGDVLIRALYWVLVSTSTVGYGDIVPQNEAETWFATLTNLFGGLAYPAVVGAVAALLVSLNAPARHHHARAAAIRAVMARERFPPALRDRVLLFLSFARRGRFGAGADEATLLASLPPPIRAEILEHEAGAALRGLPFLADVPPAVLRRLLVSLRPVLFAPPAEGEGGASWMVEEGALGDELFLLTRGEAALVAAGPEGRRVVLAVVGAGAAVGAAALLPGERSPWGAEPRTYVEALAFRRADFDATLPALDDDGRSAVRSAVAAHVDRERELRRSVIANLEHSSKARKVTGYGAVAATVGSPAPVMSPVRTESGGEASPTDEGSPFAAAVPRSWHGAYASMLAHPESPWRQAWSGLLIAALLYNVAAVPLRLALPTPFASYAADWALDAVLIADAWLRARRFAFLRGGWLVTAPDAIWSHYRRTRLTRDALALFPYELLALPAVLALGGASQWRGALVLAAARVPKLALCVRLPRLAADAARALAASLHVPAAALFVCRLLLSVLLVCHWTACGWYALARYRALPRADACAALPNVAMTANGTSLLSPLGMTPRAECEWGGTWLQLQTLDGLLPPDLGTVAWRYLRALNWALPTLVVVVIGDVTPVTMGETLYCLAAILVGLSVNATVIGSIANLVTDVDTPSSRLRAKRDLLERWMTLHDVPAPLRERARAILSLRWRLDRGIDQDEALARLPVAMRAPAAWHVRRDHVNGCAALALLDERVRREVALHMRRVVVGVGDVLARAGEAAREAYFVHSGAFEVAAAGTSRVLGTVVDGAVVAPRALVYAAPHAATVRCVDPGVVFTLSKGDLDAILARFPEPPAADESAVPRMTRMARAVDDLEHRALMTGVAAAPKAKPTEKATPTQAPAQEGGERPLSHEDNARDVTRFKSQIGASVAAAEAALVPRWVLPRSTPRLAWSAAQVACTVWFAWADPFRAAFAFAPMGWGAWAVAAAGWTADAVAAADVVLRATRLARVDAGELVWRPRELWRRYRASRAPLLDAVTLFPYDLVVLAVVGTSAPQLLGVARLPRLLRLGALPGHVRGAVALASRLGAPLGGEWRRLAATATAYLFAQHWLGCGWMALHRFAERGEELTWATVDGVSAWDEARGEHDICTGGDVVRCYMRAYYFVTIVVSTTGYGDIRPYTPAETVYQLLVVLMGAFLIAAGVGSFQSLFAAFDSAGESAHRTAINALWRYMKERRLPPQVCAAVERHHRMAWEQTSGLDHAAVLAGASCRVVIPPFSFY